MLTHVKLQRVPLYYFTLVNADDLRGRVLCIHHGLNHLSDSRTFTSTEDDDDDDDEYDDHDAYNEKPSDKYKKPKEYSFAGLILSRLIRESCKCKFRPFIFKTEITVVCQSCETNSNVHRIQICLILLFYFSSCRFVDNHTKNISIIATLNSTAVIYTQNFRGTLSALLQIMTGFTRYGR